MMTFAKLEALCAGKGIVCERRGNKIELVTPCGGTTAECDGVQDAYSTYATDPAFSTLPIKLRAAPQPQRSREFDSEISESDRRIAQSIRQLCGSLRGKNVLKAWKRLCDEGGTGLDGSNWFALQTLVNETANGRRDYLDAI